MVKSVTFIVYKLYFNFLKGEEREKENEYKQKQIYREANEA